MDLNYLILRCPKCGARLIDASFGIKTLVKTIEAGDCWEADYCTKCHLCKAKIGIRKEDRTMTDT